MSQYKENLKDIEVGDYVICDYGGRVSRYTLLRVERVTKTQIILPNDIKYNKVSGKRVGDTGYNVSYIYAPLALYFNQTWISYYQEWLEREKKASKFTHIMNYFHTVSEKRYSLGKEIDINELNNIYKQLYQLIGDIEN